MTLDDQLRDTPVDSRRIRTFKPRRRPLSSRRQAVYDDLAPRWCLSDCGAAIDLSQVFGRVAPVVLDIGIGFGESAVTAAADDPERDVVGADVHTPGVAATLEQIDELGLANIRVVHGDALEFLDRLPDASLDGINVLFPDPWPKMRHAHRRLAGGNHLDRLVRALVAGGWLHLATDMVDYATFAEAQCGAHSELTGGRTERPAGRAITRYERKAIDAGREVVDLHYEKSLEKSTAGIGRSQDSIRPATGIRAS